MTPCPRALDPIDAEAVAAGAEPVFAADAAAHARQCPACGAAVAAAGSFSEALGGLLGASDAISNLSDRVARLRAFSARERRTYALWNTPVLLTLGVGVAGFLLLDLSNLTGSEQLSAGAAALAPLAALVRSTLRWALDLVRTTPIGLEAPSEGLRNESGIGLAALALLVPMTWGLRRILARASARR